MDTTKGGAYDAGVLFVSSPSFGGFVIVRDFQESGERARK
jgi:hypothetical protein